MGFQWSVLAKTKLGVETTCNIGFRLLGAVLGLPRNGYCLTN